jgi:hypothetical protein
MQYAEGSQGAQSCVLAQVLVQDVFLGGPVSVGAKQL